MGNQRIANNVVANRPFKEDFDQILGAIQGQGVKLGCTPSIGSGLTVSVASGVYVCSGHINYYSGGSVTLSADASNPRWCSVYLKDGGVLATVNGTAQATPGLPAMPDNASGDAKGIVGQDVKIADVYLTAGATSIASGNFYDVRTIIDKKLAPDNYIVASDYPTLEAAFTAAQNQTTFPNGCTIQLDVSRTVTSTITVNNPKVNMIGLGKNITITNNVNGPLFYFTSLESPSAHSIWANFTISGGSSTTYPNQVAMKFNYATCMAFDDMEIKNFAGTNATALLFESSCYYMHFNNVYMMTGNDRVVTFLHRSTDPDSNSGATEGDSGQMLFTNCDMSGLYWCLDRVSAINPRTAPTAGLVHRMKFDRCHFTGAQGTLGMANTAGIFDTTFTECDFETSPTDAATPPTQAQLITGGATRIVGCQFSMGGQSITASFNAIKTVGRTGSFGHWGAVTIQDCVFMNVPANCTCIYAEDDVVVTGLYMRDFNASAIIYGGDVWRIKSINRSGSFGRYKYAGTAQALTANTAAKLTFNTVVADYVGEYQSASNTSATTITQGTFKKSDNSGLLIPAFADFGGTYMISANVDFASDGTNELYIAIKPSGGSETIIARTNTPKAGGLAINTSYFMLPATEVFVYAKSSATNTISVTTGYGCEVSLSKL